jgi:hypothetical protein
MTAITIVENPPLVPSYWNHMTSTVAINAWLGKVRTWQGPKSGVLNIKVIPVQVAYTDSAQKQRYEHRTITSDVETDATSDISSDCSQGMKMPTATLPPGQSRYGIKSSTVRR